MLLWHMHQPPYKSPLSDEYLLPWVLLHAMRDYYDMPALASRFDRIRPVFNLVPGLLLQIEEYANQSAKDVFLRVALKEPSELTRDERAFILDNFFSVHPETMLRPYPRYAELADKAVSLRGLDQLESRFSDQEIMDIQVWFFLTWTGFSLREDERVKALFQKKKDFSQVDKQELKGAVLDQLVRITPQYAELHSGQRIEVSCSPMYHPILPLLVNTSSALEALPRMRLPAVPFAFPEDAVRQVTAGLAYMAERLGSPVKGMWPPEGSVSSEVLRIMDRSRVDWVATDEKVLFSSLNGTRGSREDLLYTPWRMGSTAIFFRDSTLSDLIGFLYSRWDLNTAVRHFSAELAKAAAASNLRNPVMTIAMDGENAWEYYVHGGMRFVERLYQELSTDDRFEVVTPSQVLAEGGDFPVLDRVAAGSWIYGDFSAWIGDPVKNMAWEQLTSARTAVDMVLRKNRLAPHELAELTDLVMRAEASDWFWWFGEGRTSRNDPQFDLLFREHLKAIYRKVGMHPPESLDWPLEPHHRSPAGVQLPLHLISPEITGRKDSYYKWLSAGWVESTHGFMHGPRRLVRRMNFGFDTKRLYFMWETEEPAERLMKLRRVSVVLHFVKPVHRDFRLYMDSQGDLRAVQLDTGQRCDHIEAQAHLVLEAAVPFFELETPGGGPVGPGSVVEVYTVITRKGREVERIPLMENIVFTIKGKELDAENWHV